MDLMNKNFWVIRAGDDAKYLQHFRTLGIAALGHMDGLPKHIIDEIDNVAPSVFNDAVKEFYSANENYSENYGYYRSAYRLYKNVNAGDIIILISGKSCCFGVVKSDPYLSDEHLYLTESKDSIPMRYKTRVEVEWGGLESTEFAPEVIKKSFRSSRAFFKVSKESKDKIIKWSAPYHISEYDEGVLSGVSLKVKSQDRLNTYHNYELNKYFLHIEQIVNDIMSGDYVDVDECIRKGVLQNTALTFQCEVMSPGVYWSEFEAKTKETAAAFALFVCCVFGNPAMADPLKENLEPQQVVEITIAAADVKNKMKESMEGMELESPRKLIPENVVFGETVSKHDPH